jgi:hypothetical protein
MAVYEGVLHEISGGNVISSEGTGGYYTPRWGITRYKKTGVDQQAGWVQRQFLDIGETRITNVVLTPQYDALVQEAVGQEVALSMTGAAASKGGRKTLVAMRTSKGITRPSRKLLLAGSTWLVLKHVVLAPVLVIIGFLFAFLASIISGSVGMAVLAAAIPVLIWWLMMPFVYAVRTFRAAGALDKAPWTAAPRMA